MTTVEPVDSAMVWAVEVNRISGAVHIVAADGAVVAVVSESRCTDPDVMRDAQLLAAAPRMAGALREIAALTASGGAEDPLVVLEQVSLALGRARGIAEGCLTLAGLDGVRRAMVPHEGARGWAE